MGNQLIKVNHGCGSVRPLGWINTDSSINSQLQKIPILGKMISKLFNPVVYTNSNFIYSNLNNKWKFSDNSIDVVYASHLFEHLKTDSANLFMYEAFRTLKSGGVLRIVVPDLYKICKKYILDYESSDFEGESTDYIMWAINMHREGQYGNLKNPFKLILLELTGYPHTHKYMYDEKSLKNIFIKFGFKDIQCMSYGKSMYIDSICEVEGSNESYLSVYLEAIKP